MPDLTASTADTPRLPDPRDRPTLTVVEAGALLGLGRDAAYRRARDGSLPTIRFGGSYRVPTAAVLRMLDLPVPGEDQPAASGREQ